MTAAIAATGIVSYSIAADIVEEHAVHASQRTLGTAAQLLDEKLRRTTITIMSLMISESFKKAMYDAAAGEESNYYAHLSAMENVFTQARINEPLIESILVTTKIGEFYSLYANRQKDVSFFDTPLYSRLSESGAPSAWIEGHEDELFGGRHRVFSFILKVFAEPAPEQAYIIVNMKEKDLIADMLHNLTDEYAGILLMTRQNIQLWEGRPDVSRSWLEYPGFRELIDPATRRGNFEFAADRREDLVSYAKLDTVNDWTLIGIQSKQDLLQELDWIRWATVFVFAGCLLGALVVSNILTGFLLKPLHKLQQLMVKVSTSDLSVRYHSDDRDEVAQVGLRFNRMMDDINGLIAAVRKVEREKRKAEIKSLTAHIDPHFLYNALNTIYWKSDLNRLDDVKQMVLSLSALFRLGLNKGQEMTTVENEAAHVEQYLIIQQLCYEGLFEYAIELEPESVKRLPILRVILQPLAENAIVHGLSERQEGGRIEVDIRLRDEDLLLSVADNGIGMDVEAVQRELKLGATSDKGYALRNIYARLKMYYGEEADLLLESEPNVRTAVTIRIPQSALTQAPEGESP